MTYAELESTILDLIDVPKDEFDPDGNLMDYGLDSFRVFDLIGQWHERGIAVDFMLLAQEPSLNGWWRVIAPRVGGAA